MLLYNSDVMPFNQGFATSEYLAAALLDQAWHALTVEAAAAVTDVGAFKRASAACSPGRGARNCSPTSAPR